MSTDQKFADYVLFEKLSATAFGDCFRAGKVVGNAVDSHALLQLFNGSSLDTESFWQLVADRRSLVDNLKDPHLGESLAFDRVDSIPYASYTYTPGRSLDLFLATVRNQKIPVPVDQAMFIIDRAALGLTAAHQVNHRGRPVQHGFLVPDLIRLSSDGEIRIVGIEAAPGLRRQLATHPAFAPYLAPEVRNGEAPTETDDVFSLGAVLFHLLCGTPLPADRAFEAAAVIEEATLGGSEEPLPSVVKNLLKNSLAPPANRIPNAVTWQQVLGRVILDGEYDPTTFNLSFLMHTIFREDLDAELSRMPRELAYRVPSTSIENREEAMSESEEPAGEAVPGIVAASARRPFLTGFAVSFLAAVVLISFYFAFVYERGHGEAVDVAEATSAGPEQPLLQTEAIEPAPEPLADLMEETLDGDPLETVTEEEAAKDMETQLAELLSNRRQDLESSLRAEYESRIQALEQRLEANESASANPPQQAAATPGPDLPIPESETAVLTEPESPIEPSAEPEGGQLTPALPSAISGLSPSTEDQTEPGGGDETEQITETLDEGLVPAAIAEEPTQTATVIFEPPKLQSPPRPKYPAAARRLRRAASVQVRVLVGANGKVIQTELPGPAAGLGFDSAAAAAARRSRWTPATRNGAPVDSWALLTIEFQP